MRNEWSRYLDLIKKGEDKVLIPAYKDMDAYSLPSEFAYLQSQDMSKIGFLQDLIRGIQKIVKPSKENKPISQSSNVVTTSVLNRIKNKWKLLVPAVAVIVAIVVGALIITSQMDSNSSTKGSGIENNLITTKYFTMQVPDYWENNFIVDITQGTGYDSMTNEFDYIVNIYEKELYESNSTGLLFGIILRQEPDFSGFSSGEKIGEFRLADTHMCYLYAIYPTDFQWNSKNSELYSKMSADIEDVINSMTSTGENKIFIYE